MNIQQQRDVIYGALDGLLVRPGKKARKSRRGYRINEHQKRPWTNFFAEVRSVCTADLGAPNPLSTGAIPRPSRYISATEPGIASAITASGLDKVGEVLEAPRMTARYSDRATGKHARQVFPDAALQAVINDGRSRLVAEYKTFWNTPLDLMEPGKLNKVLGQCVKYMDEYNCVYGFVCTYQQAIFMRRIGPYVFQISPVVYGDHHVTMGQLSMRECFYFMAKMASTSGWKWHGKPGIPNLLNGRYSPRYTLRSV